MNNTSEYTQKVIIEIISKYPALFSDIMDGTIQNNSSNSNSNVNKQPTSLVISTNIKDNLIVIDNDDVLSTNAAHIISKPDNRNFSTKQVELPPQNNNSMNNAFNNKHNISYRYQYTDIELIGKMLIAEHNKAQAPGQQIIYASPLRASGKDLENFQVDPNKHLKKFTDDLNRGIKIVGLFNADGNHWISYLLFKDQNDQQIKCIYKDSLGHKRYDFIQTFLKAFYDDKNIPTQYHDNIIICATEKVAEQMIQFEPMNNHINCGIFALKNMIIVADIAKYLNKNSFNNLKELMKSVKFFSPGNTKDTYQTNIGLIRIEFSDKYRDYVSQEAINNTIARINVNKHNTEAEAFAKLFNIKKEYVEICSIFDKPKEYAYKINYGSNTELYNHYTRSFTQQYIEFQDDITSKVLLIKSKTIYSWLLKYMTILNQNELGAIIQFKNLIDHNNTAGFVVDKGAVQYISNLIDNNLSTNNGVSKDYISQMINRSIINDRPATLPDNPPYETSDHDYSDNSRSDKDIMGNYEFV